MNNKIVYVWLNAGIPFYIGIGNPKRAYYKSRRNPLCDNKRAKAEREGTFEIRILHENLTWQEACELEQSYISLYGRRNLETGILTNMTDGGDGLQGYRHTKETKQLLREQSTGQIVDIETRKKISRSLSGIKRSEKFKKKCKENSWLKGLPTEQNPKSKPVMTPEGRFESIKQAAEHFPVTPKGLGHRCRNPKNKQFYFL